ncbi:MAG: DUF5333 family protein [Ruegeria sp.]
MTSGPRNTLRSLAAVAATAGAGSASADSTAALDQAVGQIFAADMISNSCNGIGRIGGSDYQQFVQAASDMAAEQGLNKRMMRRLLIYGKTAWLEQQAAAVLSARGVEPGNTGKMCAFAQEVAGKNDTIGRFLIKE